MLIFGSRARSHLIRLILVTLLGLSLGVPSTHAEIKIWTDKNGTIHLIDTNTESRGKESSSTSLSTSKTRKKQEPAILRQKVLLKNLTGKDKNNIVKEYNERVKKQSVPSAIHGKKDTGSIPRPSLVKDRKKFKEFIENYPPSWSERDNAFNEAMRKENRRNGF